MAQRNMLPTNVFIMQLDPAECYKRSKGDNSFDGIGDILSQRITSGLTHQPQIHYFFQKLYNSV